MKPSENPYAGWEGPLHTDLYEWHNILNGGGPAYGRLQDELISDIESRWATLNPKLIIDVGAASGHSSIRLANKYPKSIVWATDLNPRALEVIEYRQGKGDIDLEARVCEGVITVEDARMLRDFYKFAGSMPSNVVVAELDMTEIDRHREDVDMISGNQSVHWLLRQGGVDRLGEFLRAARNVLKDGHPIAFNMNLGYCKPVNPESLDRHMDRHPFRRRYLDIVALALQERGESPEYSLPTPGATAELVTDLMRSASFEPLVTRDVVVPYPLGVVIQFAYHMLPRSFGLMDNMKHPMADAERREFLVGCRDEALKKYVPEDSHRQFEHSVNVQFVGRAA